MSVSAGETTRPNELAAHIGGLLEVARGPRSRREVADALGWTTPRNLLAIEQGGQNPTLDTLERWSAAYGGRVEFDFILGDGSRIEVPAPEGSHRRLAAQVGAVLAAARETLDDSRADVAVRMDRVRNRRGDGGQPGVSRHGLLSIERGEANPTLGRLERAAAAYGGRFEVRFVVETVSPPGTSS